MRLILAFCALILLCACSAPSNVYHAQFICIDGDLYARTATYEAYKRVYAHEGEEFIYLPCELPKGTTK